MYLFLAYYRIVDGCLINNFDSHSLGVGNEEPIAEEYDEEVFFGPQTHQERIAAVVVKEQEAKQAPVETLNAEQQAQLLRESALLSVRIKHGTPGSVRSSPVAVVHPMPRKEAKNSNNSITENKENVPKSTQKKMTKSLLQQQTSSSTSSLLDNSKLKSAKILQSRFGLNKSRPSSQPEAPVTTKLPVSKSRGKIQSDLSEVST